MDLMFRNIGLFTVITTLLVLIKKRYDWIYLQQEGSYEDNTVYKAADLFANGAPPGEVRAILATSFEFDPKGTEQILARALPRRMEPDGGHRAFIQAVNEVLGDEIYRS
ncbi:hypothetical protein [Paenibacillus borealis]|uniref:Uncharacterized protein n=1 Tax=Paenibacillus borealis TaxID=160799 RepID=A0A089LCL3_PAEBO|nr:hypothetical protein [Paenibacillus borealis]AIQ58587.1 hypothetical protein PBOR_17795 [Paenibacillus borealis]